jgi:hypothetical protein
MQKVEGSNPFIRSISVPSRGDVAEWLGTGLQNPLHRFKSGRRLLVGHSLSAGPPPTTRWPAPGGTSFYGSSALVCDSTGSTMAMNEKRCMA